ncbi:MAG: hypothetical protein EPO52_17545 [Herbiconiux sp.]|uniref:hypothetical protein n=1 Tax=Herbiconiux sp. TaxID=1871186 RepID=UPI0011FEED49|nr:hypothetical protein [Herbiconiux sp.]TAJ46337.1 MAG: hypothetical protein EPO52_17545 [Herbiconiux sp.]
MNDHEWLGTLHDDDGGVKGVYPPARCGESSVQLDASVYPDEAIQFSFEVEWWEIAEPDVDKEFADIRSIIDQLEAQCRDFIEQVRGKPATVTELADLRPVFLKPTGGDAA